MSVCNFTQPITPNTCVGDSLATINSNFASLDEGICNIPRVNAGPGIFIAPEISERNTPVIKISTKNSFVYGTQFDYKSGVVSELIPLSDGTSINANTFPYVENPLDYNPYAIFSTISLTDSAPKVTLYWTASGTTNATTYATNYSWSVYGDGPISFNGPVTALLSSGNFLYVGGEFTTVGGVDCKKFCVIDLLSGTEVPLLGTTGALVNSPLSALGDMGTVGTVHAIAEYQNLIILGGSFRSLSKGRGLTILNRSTGVVYPFYVNGTVNDVLVVGDSLYVGGDMDYINYTAQSASVISNLRVPTNGLAKISLSTLIGFPNSSIDSTFAATARETLREGATINSFAVKNGTIYIGGNFEIHQETGLAAKNLAILNSDGTQNVSWKPIIDGSVFTLAIDEDYLYVGGGFSSVHTSSQFFSVPRTNDETTVASNAACFKISTPVVPIFQTNWKPKFNGTVTRFAFHDNAFNSYVYCYGEFTRANDTDVEYIAAVEKSYNNLNVGSSIDWKVSLQHGPNVNNQGLLRYDNSLIIAGSFTKINNESRFYLARVNGVEESTSTATLSSVTWELGTQVCSPGTSLAVTFSNTVQTSGYCGEYGIVNQTSFSPTATRSSEGTLMRFFVKRPNAIGTLKKPVHVIGWKIDFN